MYLLHSIYIFVKVTQEKCYFRKQFLGTYVPYCNLIATGIILCVTEICNKYRTENK